MEAYGVPYAQASVAKALFDYLYLRPLPADLDPRHYNLAEELRLNLDELTPEERGRICWLCNHQRHSQNGTHENARVKMKRILNNLECTRMATLIQTLQNVLAEQRPTSSLLKPGASS